MPSSLLFPGGLVHAYRIQRWFSAILPMSSLTQVPSPPTGPTSPSAQFSPLPRPTSLQSTTTHHSTPRPVAFRIVFHTSQLWATQSVPTFLNISNVPEPLGPPPLLLTSWLHGTCSLPAHTHLRVSAWHSWRRAHAEMFCGCLILPPWAGRATSRENVSFLCHPRCQLNGSDMVGIQ